MAAPGEISSSARAFVLNCIDPRFVSVLDAYLIEDKELHNDFDQMSFAGAEAGPLTHTKWKKTLEEHIELAIKLHGIKKFLCYSHMGCAAYKAFFDLKEDNDSSLHVKQLRKMKKYINKTFPELQFCGYLMFLDGTIKKVVK